ncbi:MAG: Dna2/Cas4 domain-containing protein [Desulfobacterales bacterium]|nr:Dna2/Cas4 domain-containing protein [Desulfobacterales bacterium]
MVANFETQIPTGNFAIKSTGYDPERAPFDDALRQQTEDTAMRLHELIASGRTPKPVYMKKCDSCSLMKICLPKTIEKKRSVKRYLSGAIRES